jgi:hypothetical protein
MSKHIITKLKKIKDKLKFLGKQKITLRKQMFGQE